LTLASGRTLAPRLFWRRKHGIPQRLGESRSDVQLASLCGPNRSHVDVRRGRYRGVRRSGGAVGQARRDSYAVLESYPGRSAIDNRDALSDIDGIGIRPAACRSSAPTICIWTTFAQS